MKKEIDFGIIIGPTAVGKTSMSIKLAKALNAEIISGDSMQIYKQLDIGTAKISSDEMEGVPHHLIDFLDPSASYSVADFQRDVREKISEIKSRNKFPLIVGGTGLYIQAVLYDYQFVEEKTDDTIRRKLEEKREQEGIEKLYEELLGIDPSAKDAIHPNNHRRVIRALEIFYQTGKTLSEQQQNQVSAPLYHAPIVGLTMDRELLYRRINQRVDIMMAKGLLQEVESLKKAGVDEVQSVQAIGYKELYDYLEGKYTLEEAIELIKQQSRRYAKRQLTWFRNKMDVQWFDLTNEKAHGEIYEEILHIFKGESK
ncbi:tRNA (adenosine(37)-N6)-dimethylallyltransferase MiaA [Mangrovibacillus cuniculi]|uniref:tRNA dimethylallyltransferase n=1 Tax=Mangrovibacillus cuniculi TaxID=2593652 RepID=A0A7S8HF58_9BACI|nr:tRNA (adenosine(37)-N6)-dimethylallyltransferase MiaA [Mangrovibacillus cuniculi]QPC46432.1 tRNA (adenosine(37)-N6)-dimethylallyltransferase MiaA [Mangrovibacillus cuniculi]